MEIEVYCSIDRIHIGPVVRAMWNTISGYKPEKGFMSTMAIHPKMVPIYKAHQGWLCPKCMKKLSAYKIEKFTDMPTTKDKKEKIKPLSLWD